MQVFLLDVCFFCKLQESLLMVLNNVVCFKLFFVCVCYFIFSAIFGSPERKLRRKPVIVVSPLCQYPHPRSAGMF